MAKEKNGGGLSPYDVYKAARQQAMNAAFGYDGLLNQMPEVVQQEMIDRSAELNYQQSEYARELLIQAQSEDAEIKKLEIQYEAMKSQFLQQFPDWSAKIESIEHKGWIARRDGAMATLKNGNIGRLL